MILQRLTERLDGGIILKRAVVPTRRTSYVGSLAQIYDECADFPALVCADIRRGDARYLDAAPSPTTAPIFKNPTNLQTALCLTRIAWARLYVEPVEVGGVGIEAAVERMRSGDTNPSR